MFGLQPLPLPKDFRPCLAGLLAARLEAKVRESRT